MISIVIADNLINDYCNPEPHFLTRRVNIGKQEINRLIGPIEKYGQGVLPAFLNNFSNSFKSNKSHGLIFIRDYFEPSDITISEELIRYGEHGIIGSEGSEFINPIKEIVNSAEIINTSTIGIDLKNLSKAITKISKVDILKANFDDKNNLKILLVGFHTEKRVLSLAGLLRNYLGIKNIAVTPHLLASPNSDAHFNALRYYYPDSLIKVLPNLDEVREFLGVKLNMLGDYNLHACQIEPEEVRKSIEPEQKEIIENLCMHWDKVVVRPLQGGFSGSLLLLADGWKSGFRTEPMVLKIDTHGPIKKELDGYQLVKDLLGKHIPTFSSPVSVGKFSGISMELASMEGKPMTLQDYYEEAKNDTELNKFLSLFERTTLLLSSKMYKNTIRDKSVVPYRQFILHIDAQAKWLNENIDHICKHKISNNFIDTSVVKRMFNLIRKNDDGLDSKMCLSHGDLNLANIICDERENIWAIDWTYTDLHPIEVDLTKLENDVKFVISKQFEAEDFTKIQLLEDYLLSTPIPQAINELPAGLKFIEWDLRFKKILLTVKIIREVYFSLKDDSDWIVYQIGLLRYAVHTLSFDMNRGQGECSPIQLWAALYSVEQLLFQLVSDDFHLKIRGERPATYPQRFRITIDQASWNIPSPEYNPPYYVDTTVLENDYKKIANGWADSEEDWKFLQDDGSEDNIDRDEEGKPINPKGRTGIAGRGLFGKWGPNPYVILLISRVNKNSGDTEILLQIDSSDDVLLPEKFIKRIETLESTKKNLLGEFFLTENRIINSKLIHEGYLYDRRQTDNAWLNANCYLLLVDELEMESDTTIASKFKWEIVSTELINQLPASRAELIRIAIDHLSKDGLIDITSAQEILKETG